MRKEEYLGDAFRHQTILNIGDEYWPILASYHSDDNQNNDFYILMSDKTTNNVDKALSATDYHQYNVKEPRSIHLLCVKSRMSLTFIFTIILRKKFHFRMVIAPWKNEKKSRNKEIDYYRAWIRSIEGSFFNFEVNK